MHPAPLLNMGYINKGNRKIIVTIRSFVMSFLLHIITISCDILLPTIDKLLKALMKELHS